MPAPSPSQILQQVRSHYVARLVQAIADYPSEGLVQMVPEAVLRGPTGELLRRGDPPTPVRVDLITLVSDQVRDGLTIESETMPGFSPVALSWRHELPVTINPFPWNACPIAIVGSIENLEPLLEWFDTWFDPEEKMTPGDDGLLGVVHSVKRTSTEGKTLALMIDFGSAPIEAFEELIEAAHKLRSRSVEIGVAPAKTI